MKAYVTDTNELGLRVCVPLDGNAAHLCFDIDKFGCLGQAPRIVNSPLIRKGFYTEIRIPDELVLCVRTIAEVSKAAEPLLRKLLEEVD